MKTFSILIGAALALALAGCGGGGQAHKHFLKVDRVDIADFSVGYFRHCYTLAEHPDGLEAKHTGDTFQDYTFKYKVGDKRCLPIDDEYGFHFSYIQTKNDTFTIHVSKKRHAGTPHMGNMEKQLLIVTALLGRENGFKHGVFDLVEDDVVDREADTIETRKQGSGATTGMTTSAYRSTYGVTFGTGRSNITTETRRGDVTIQRKHVVKFYKDDPGIEGSFDVGLLLKSLSKKTHYEARNL